MNKLPPPNKPVAIIHGFRRRELLKLGAAAAGASLLPACDFLQLPERNTRPPADPGFEISPITAIGDFYLQQYDEIVELNAAEWSLVITDGEESVTITRDFLDGLEPREREHTLECIGTHPRNQAIGNAIWSGLPLPEVFEALGFSPTLAGRHTRWTCADGYDVGLPAEDLERMWLVWGMNGEDLPAGHGYPARVLNPGRYGTKNPKWPTTLELIDDAHTGFWERRGWSDAATYRPNTLIRLPGDGYSTTLDQLADGTMRLVGFSFAGEDDVTRVELRVDDGPWEDAELTYNPGGHIWGLWAYEWVPDGPGTYTVQARVTTASGAMSEPTTRRPGDLGGYNGSMSIDVVIL